MHSALVLPGLRLLGVSRAVAESSSPSATDPEEKLLPVLSVVAVNAALEACQTSAALAIRATGAATVSAPRIPKRRRGASGIVVMAGHPPAFCGLRAYRPVPPPVENCGRPAKACRRRNVRCHPGPQVGPLRRASDRPYRESCAPPAQA